MDEQVPQVARFPFREQARKHLKSAEELLCGEGQQLVYACLELRLAIEAIVYETLQAYEKNLSPDVAEAHQHWQPNKVLELLSAHDRLVDTSLRVQFREGGENGAPVGGPPLFDGIDRRLTVNWVEKAHRSLGSFLHQRTVSQLKKGKSIDETKLRTEANRIHIRLKEVLGSEVYGIQFAGGLPICCETCGSDLAATMASLILDGVADVKCATCNVSRLVELDKTTGELRYVHKITATG
ncbi:hypothetical protein ACTJK5_18855 [Agrobacterium sp. 22094]|uniref:hypothetical protein n=1 Tax=Agrobacterium sp. 22094 TaxID=3453872 RepID=UPI000DDAE226